MPYYLATMRFQFHKVRLKGDDSSLSPCTKLFQFHKVRLKAFVERKGFAGDQVSIP